MLRQKGHGDALKGITVFKRGLPFCEKKFDLDTLRYMMCSSGTLCNEEAVMALAKVECTMGGG